MSPHFRLKKLTAYPEWHRKPFLLNRVEMAAPQTVLIAFFDRYDLSGIRISLRQWLDDAAYATEADAASHLRIHKDVGKLIEAAWVMWQNGRKVEADKAFDEDTPNQSESRLQEETDDDVKKDKRRRFVKWVPFPSSLKATPLNYLKRVFEQVPLDCMEGYVYQWQKIALSAAYDRYDEPGERADLLDFCEGFLRLLQVAYVLQRSMEWDTEGRTKWHLSEELKFDLLTEEQTYRISEEEIGNPYTVIENFFQTFSPAYARRELWDMLGCVVECERADIKKLDLLLEFEYLEAVLEASWLLHQQSKRSHNGPGETNTEGL